MFISYVVKKLFEIELNTGKIDPPCLIGLRISKKRGKVRETKKKNQNHIARVEAMMKTKFFGVDVSSIFRSEYHTNSRIFRSCHCLFSPLI